MMILDHEITAFKCLTDAYVTVVEGLAISWDLLESRRKVISGCVGEPFNYNIVLFLVNNLALYCISLDHMGKENFRRTFHVAPQCIIMTRT